MAFNFSTAAPAAAAGAAAASTTTAAPPHPVPTAATAATPVPTAVAENPAGGPTSSATTSTCTLRKSLRELGVGAAGLGSSSASGSELASGTAQQQRRQLSGFGFGAASSSSLSLSYASEAAAHRLLARSGRGFDSAQFGRDARELETRSSHHPAAQHHYHAAASTTTASSSSTFSTSGSTGSTGNIGMAMVEAQPKTPFGVRSGLLSSGRGEYGGAAGGSVSGLGLLLGGGGSTSSGRPTRSSVHVAGGTTSTTTPGPDGGGGGARALFGSHPTRSTTSRGTSSGTSTIAAANAADLATYLSAHHAANVTRILDSTRLSAERSANAIIRARLEHDWLMERMRIVGSGPAAAAGAGTGAAAGAGVGAGGGEGIPAGGLAARLAQEARTAAQTPRHSFLVGTSGNGAGSATPHALRFGPSGAPTPAYNRHGASADYDTSASAEGSAGVGIRTAASSVPGPSGTAPGAGVVNFALDAARVISPALLNERSIGDHATVVAALNHSRRGTEEGGERRKVMSAEQLVDGIRAIVLSGVGTYCTSTGEGGARNQLSAASLSAAQTVDRGYLAALDVTSSLLRMTTSADAGRSGGSTNRADCRSQTLGSLHHLAEQYRSHILATVSRSTMTGSSTSSSSSSSFGEGGSNGFAAHVAAYVDLELGQVSSAGNTSGAAASPWRRIYHCLRCGDLAAALATLDRMPSSRGNDLVGAADVATVAASIKYLSDFQGANHSMWLAAAGASESGSNGIEKLLASVPSEVCSSLAELRHAATMSSSGGNVGDSVYFTACLSLLCLGSTSQMNDGSANAGGAKGASSVASTVEDYLYEGLWGAFFQRKIDASVAAIASLGEAVRHFGPFHFEDDGNAHGGRSFGIASMAQLASVANETPLSGGWAFAIPLMVCQQFESALTYLARVGGPAGLLQATHLAMALHLGGIELVDLHAPHYPMHSSFSGSGLFTSLLSSYASTLSKPSAALEYLVCIPDSAANAGGSTSSVIAISRTAKTYVQSLIVESAFEDVVGTMGPDGNRMSGLLDVHFSPSEISDLVSAASSEALRRGRGRDAAELLSLAGRYTSLLSLLNSELASLLVVEDPSDQEFAEKRVFWRTAGDNFHNMHLRGGPNHVLAALEAENRMDLTTTFALIMNLMVFFDRCQSRDWEGAWSLIDEIGIFPSEEGTMSRKVANYQTIDTALKGRPFRRAVLCAMESLYQQHSALKGRVGGSKSSEFGAINQRVGDLRKRARLLVTFAGLCRLDGDVSAKIAQMEAYMV